jgi:hypothetical protein
MWLWSLECHSSFRDSDQLRNMAWNERSYYTGVPSPLPEWADRRTDWRTDGPTTCDFRASRASLFLLWCFLPARRWDLCTKISINFSRFFLVTISLKFSRARERKTCRKTCFVVLRFQILVVTCLAWWSLLLHSDAIVAVAGAMADTTTQVCLFSRTVFKACRGGLNFVRLFFSTPRFFSPLPPAAVRGDVSFHCLLSFPFVIVCSVLRKLFWIWSLVLHIEGSYFLCCSCIPIFSR